VEREGDFQVPRLVTSESTVIVNGGQSIGSSDKALFNTSTLSAPNVHHCFVRPVPGGER
jgi:hypothetical protein